MCPGFNPAWGGPCYDARHAGAANGSAIFNGGMRASPCNSQDRGKSVAAYAPPVARARMYLHKRTLAALDGVEPRPLGAVGVDVA